MCVCVCVYAAGWPGGSFGDEQVQRDVRDVGGVEVVGGTLSIFFSIFF